LNVADFCREDFAGFQGKMFTVSAGAELSFVAELIEVAPMGETVGPTGRRAFSLVLRGPGTDEPVQQVYRVEHEDLGSLELFLVPFGPDDKGMKYEAVFT
jgi:hypothetical protein